MLIKQRDAAAFDWNGLSIRDSGSLLDGAASVAVIEAPAGATHPLAYSSRCDKLYFVLEGAVWWVVNGVVYLTEPGDLLVVRKGTRFRYEPRHEQPARMLLAHLPAFDPEAEQVLPDLLREHDVHLQGEQVTLRPMTESDWEPIFAWESDSEAVAWFNGPDDPPDPTLAQVQSVYRGVSAFACNFIIEYHREPIGVCWLQKLNLPDLIARFPGRDLRRIDLMIGRMDLRNRGLGTDTLRTLVRFAFEQERADGVFGLVDSGNHRSRRAFQKAGFSELPGWEAEGERALVVWREG